MNDKELEKRVKELEAELAKRRFGLVWDKEKNIEEAVAICSNKLPILKHECDKDIISDKNAINHLLIEGDNFHSLSALLYTHAGLIDFIYIDPPYNTGNNDFIYNDRFVDKLDGHTDESTPPESANSTFLSPTCSLMFLISCSI